MDEKTDVGFDKEKRGILSSIFPREYDFERMLAEQAEQTCEGVRVLVDWLHETPLSDPEALDRLEKRVDEMRHDLEEKLIVSFSTPFDRQDIYSLSRQIDYILNYARETARECYAFGVFPDPSILAMAAALLEGTKDVAEAVRSIGSDGERVEEMIRKARRAKHELEMVYIEGMASLLRTEDAMEAMRKREIYHHLRDGGRALRNTLDILHRSVVGLS